MNVFEMEKEFNDLIKYGQELIEKLKQEKEPVKEADENDIGKLCYFYEDDDVLYLGILGDIDEEGLYSRKSGSRWTHCRRLTPSEVAEITGYKVEE